MFYFLKFSYNFKKKLIYIKTANSYILKITISTTKNNGISINFECQYHLLISNIRNLFNIYFYVKL